MSAPIETSRIERSAVSRIVGALVRAELARLRGSPARLPTSEAWQEDALLGDEGLGIDSLERLGIHAALAEMFGVDADRAAERRIERLGDLTDWAMDGFGGADATLSVATSGSTGTPRPCTHLIADLLDEAQFFANMMADRRRIVAMVPAHHLYGLIWTALLPSILSVPVIEHDAAAGADWQPGDLIVAVPDQWQALPRFFGQLPPGIWGVSSGGPLSCETGTGALGGGVERLFDVYGASELGGIAMRIVPDPDYRLLPRWRFAVGGDALVDRLGALHPLPDRVKRRGERSFGLLGRRDRAVQVGGHNVWPQQVASLLRAMPGVKDAAVRLGEDARLNAFVVPMDGIETDILVRSLGRDITALPMAERPSRFTFGAALPRGPMGKLETWS